MSRQQVIRHIVDRQRNKLNLSEAIVAQEEPELHRLACECFGTWDTALLYTGVNPQRVWNQRPYTREEVLQAIRQLCWNGNKISACNAQRHYNRLYRTARKYFGCWRNALQAAGINIKLSGLNGTHARRMTKEEILGALRQWQAAGRSLRWRDISLENRRLAASAKAAFFSWDKALLAAGLPLPPADQMPNRSLTRDQVLEAIRERQQDGKSISRQAVRRDDPSLCSNVRAHFTRWNLALLAAGVIPKPPGRPPRKKTKPDNNFES